MDLRQLEAFAAVMTAGSITGAGQMLKRSQPAVTRSIQDLEQELGLRLFERNGPKVIPTNEAFLLRSEVEGSLASVRRIRQQAGNISRRENSEVRLAATSALAAGLVPAALARLSQVLRPQQIQLQSMLAEQVVQAALANTLDIGVVSLPLEHRGLELHWIGESVCVAVVASDSRYARFDVIDLSDLGDDPLPLVTLSNPYRLRGRIDHALEDARIAGHRVQETNASLNAVMLARADIAIALVEPATALGIPIEGVVVKPLLQRVPFFFGVVSPYAQQLSPTVRALIAALEEVAGKLLPDFVSHPSSQHDAVMQRIYGRVGAR
ncbi:LysR family transcriptional regulator [Luteimonas sp. RIT-PG2_3]